MDFQHRNGILVYDQDQKEVFTLFDTKIKPENSLDIDVHDIKSQQDSLIYFTAGNQLFKINSVSYAYKVFTPASTADKIDKSKIAPYGINFTNDHRLFVNSALRIYELKNDKLLTVYPDKGFSSFSIEDIFYCMILFGRLLQGEFIKRYFFQKMD